MDRQRLKSADGESHRESNMVGDFWHGPGRDDGGFWSDGWTAQSSRTARLASPGFPRERLGRKKLLQTIGDVGDLPAVGTGDSAIARNRSEEPLIVARPAVSNGR